jgi:purine-nucleoside phosphorylase
VVELLDPEPRVAMPYRDCPTSPAPPWRAMPASWWPGGGRARRCSSCPGRAHPYEGYSHREATLLLRAVLALGVETLVVTNAAGGLNPAFDPGDVMLITDHINLSGDNPLIGPNLDRFGPRFPPMTDAYDPALRALAIEVGRAQRRGAAPGVYIMLAGPSYETRAEMRMLRTLGADAVGMSTAHEVIVARHAGVRVLGLQPHHEQGDR